MIGNSVASAAHSINMECSFRFELDGNSHSTAAVASKDQIERPEFAQSGEELEEKRRRRTTGGRKGRNDDADFRIPIKLENNFPF